MYPGLPSHPQHQIAKKQMKMFSGMIAAEIRGGVQGGKILVEVYIISNHQNIIKYGHALINPNLSPGVLRVLTSSIVHRIDPLLYKYSARI